jgi:protein TonB
MPVETPPVVVQKSRPEYPEAAAAAGVQGTVTVEVTVAGSGDVTEAHVIQSTPELDAAAVHSVRGWRFRPATRDGVAIESKTYVTVAFTLMAKPVASP